MQECAVCLCSLIAAQSWMRTDPDQFIPVINEEEMVCLTYNGCPEGWRNSLQRSKSELTEMPIEQLIAYFKPLNTEGRKAQDKGSKDAEKVEPKKSRFKARNEAGSCRDKKCCCKHG